LLLTATLSQSPAQAAFRLILTEGEVSVARKGGAWRSTPVRPPQTLALNPGDRVRTGEHSRATIEQAGRGVIHLNELTIWGLRQVDRGPRRGDEVDLERGLMYFFSRELRDDLRVRTPSCVGALRGTEFVAEVGANGSSVFSMLGGALELSNPSGVLEIRAGDSAEVLPGRAPRLRAKIATRKLIQWHLYYPAVLDVDELQLRPEERKALANSLPAWRKGDVLGAFEAFPRRLRFPPGSDANAFRAAVLLTTGQVDEARSIPIGNSPAATAVRSLIATVTADRGAKGTAIRAGRRSPSEWLAESYEHQAEGNLVAALEAATQATHLASGFGYAWARKGELEFALGRHATASASLVRALDTAPANAQAWALRGFVESSMQRREAAVVAFARATTLDGSLANGWLGLGLLAWHRGDSVAGRRLLLIAAAQEPDRSLLRSTLARALAEDGMPALAAEEVERARRLDPLDPTPWLVSALLRQHNNDINQAVADVEESLRLNRNRRIYRPDYLLDRDEATRRSNLAAVFTRVGLENLAIKEASWGLLGDYANPDAHLFLANSYGNLRDPTGIELELDAAWQNEWLLANLLAPPGAAVLSRTIGLEEYGGFFDRAGHRGQTRAIATDNGDIGFELGHQIRGEHASFAVDLAHHESNGYRVNNQSRRWDGSITAKTQLSLQDSLFFHAGWREFDGGDLFRLPSRGLGRPDLRFEEETLPSVWLGLTHHWEQEGVTMFLAGYHRANQLFADQRIDTLNLARNPMGAITGTAPLSMDLWQYTEVDLQSVEITHIQQWKPVQLVLGGKVHWGDIEVSDLLTNPPAPLVPFFSTPPANSRFRESIRHASLYGYGFWDLSEKLTLQAGATWDSLKFPANFRHAPLSPGHETEEGLSLKGGLLWHPSDNLSLWAAYAESLGGITFDESLTLEPSQTAGMLHNYRSVISESLVGSVTAPGLELAGLGIKWKPRDDLFVELDGRWRASEVQRMRGAFTLQGATPLDVDVTPEILDYEEWQLRGQLTWLFGHQFALALSHSWTSTDLVQAYPEFPAGGAVPPRITFDSSLHDTALRFIWNHPGGMFGELSGHWLQQDNNLFADEDLFLLDLELGYRHPSSGTQVSAGVMNLADERYQLNPLTIRSEPVGERTFFIEIVRTY
jgi:outer membrane receptor protein involved in Fe transport